MDEENKRRLEQFLEKIRYNADHFLGYPCNELFDYTHLYPFLKYHLNNVGDPYAQSSIHLNTHDFEREVIARLARLTRAGEDDIWGYVTSGGTEGNMYGIYLARELHPEGIVYYSEDTHYSVTKILRMLGARNIMIKSSPDGEMDYDDLAETIAIYRDRPPIIFANIGTTMKGAVDNLDRIRAVLKDRAISRYYIHADAALSGMILPFVTNPQPFGFDAGIDSIAISGHKMIGSPVPCGIALARRSHVRRVARAIEYIGSLDTTVTGSRSGLSVLIIWSALAAHGEEGFHRMLVHSFKMADYAIEKFREAGIEAWRHNNSITVVFPRLAKQAFEKWQIAVQKDIAHLITMPHVTRRHIDAFMEDFLKEAQP